jgi:hypothetical protein
VFRDFDSEVWQGAVYQGVDYSWRFEVSTFGRIRNAITGKIYSCGYGAGGYQQRDSADDSAEMGSYHNHCHRNTRRHF